MTPQTLPRAAELPDDVKQKMFELLREKVGDDVFNHVRDMHGEDGLVEFFFAAMAHKPAPEPTRVEKAFEATWKHFKDWFWIFFNFVVAGGPIGIVITVVWLTFAFFIALASGDKAEERIIIVVGVVGLVVCAVAFGPWLITGVRSWWGWLGGHF